MAQLLIWLAPPLTPPTMRLGFLVAAIRLQRLVQVARNAAGHAQRVHVQAVGASHVQRSALLKSPHHLSPGHCESSRDERLR